MGHIARTFGRAGTDEDSSRVPAFSAFTFFTVAYNGSVQSAAIDHEALSDAFGFIAVRFTATTNCWVEIGEDPTAVVGSGIYLPAGVVEIWRIPIGSKVAAITDTGAGAGTLSLSVLGRERLAPVTVEGAVMVSADDAREAISTTVVDIDGNNLSWNQAGICGFRMVLDTPIPQGKTILSAAMTVFPNQTIATAFTGRVRGEASGSPVEYAEVNASISGRALTTAFIDVVNPAFVEAVGFEIDGLEAIVQEIVDANELSALAIQLTEVSGDSRSIRTIENSTVSSPALLSIRYQP